MKNSFRTILVPLALSLGVFAGCNKTEGAAKDMKNAAKAATENLDLSKLSGDALKTNVAKTFTDLTAKLGDIKDEASAKDLVGKFGPMIDQLSGMKSKLSGMMPDGAGLTKAISGLTEKFKGNAGVLNLLQPFFDKITALLK